MTVCLSASFANVWAWALLRAWQGGWNRRASGRHTRLVRQYSPGGQQSRLPLSAAKLVRELAETLQTSLDIAEDRPQANVREDAFRIG